MRLNDKEKTDFITFWLPVLLKNKLSLCSFKSKQFFNDFELNINPKRDSLIRIFLIIQKLDSPIKSLFLMKERDLLLLNGEVPNTKHLNKYKNINYLDYLR